MNRRWLPFQGGPLNFSLTSRGLAVTGQTNSATELRAFIEKLESLSDLLPELFIPPALDEREGHKPDTSPSDEAEREQPIT